jgi:bacillithiol system protein YtxJ
MMTWIQLESAEQLNNIKQQPGYSLIFKHSTRCSISMMAKRRFELDWENLTRRNAAVFFRLDTAP